MRSFTILEEPLPLHWMNRIGSVCCVSSATPVRAGSGNFQPGASTQANCPSIPPAANWLKRPDYKP